MTRRRAVAGLLVACLMGCWHVSQLGSDAGIGGDADSDIDTDADADSDSGVDCAGDGVWYDETSGLCWQNPPSGSSMGWSAAVSYCDNLDLGGHSDWRLPNTNELISLLRGCVDGTETGDLSPSLCTMTPVGCTNNCTGTSNCDSCSSLSGPGDGGCYWDPALSGECTWCWSSSPYDSAYAWSVHFASGHVYYYHMDSDHGVRCVR